MNRTNTHHIAAQSRDNASAMARIENARIAAAHWRTDPPRVKPWPKLAQWHLDAALFFAIVAGLAGAICAVGWAYRLLLWMVTR